MANSALRNLPNQERESLGSTDESAFFVSAAGAETPPPPRPTPNITADGVRKTGRMWKGVLGHCRPTTSVALRLLGMARAGNRLP